MTIPLFGILISSFMVGGSIFLFRYEERRGGRFFPHMRALFDRWVTVTERKMTMFSRHVGRRMLRQTFHYLFHRILTNLLRFIEYLEHSVQRALRMNRSIARKLNTGERPRNKLDEIAEHKQSTALSEAEKKKHKQRSLEG